MDDLCLPVIRDMLLWDCPQDQDRHKKSVSKIFGTPQQVKIFIPTHEWVLQGVLTMTLQIPIACLAPLSKSSGQSDARLKMVDVLSAAEERLCRPEDFRGFVGKDFKKKCIVVLFNPRQCFFLPTKVFADNSKAMTRFHLKNGLQFIAMGIDAMSDGNIMKLSEEQEKAVALAEKRLGLAAIDLAKALKEPQAEKFFADKIDASVILPETLATQPSRRKRPVAEAAGSATPRKKRRTTESDEGEAEAVAQALKRGTIKPTRKEGYLYRCPYMGTADAPGPCTNLREGSDVRQGFIMHMVTAHGYKVLQEPFECLRCHRRYPTRMQLVRHQHPKPTCASVDEEDKPGYECSICFDNFTRKDNQNRHYRQKHSKMILDSAAYDVAQRREAPTFPDLLGPPLSRAEVLDIFRPSQGQGQPKVCINDLLKFNCTTLNFALVTIDALIHVT